MEPVCSKCFPGNMLDATAYEDRWMIKLVMRFYKSACEFDDTRVHSDYSVIGSEFCDFLATVLTWRLIKAFTKSRLLDKLTYKRVMTFLRRAKMVKVGDGDWQPVKVAPAVEKALAALSLDPKEAIVAAMSDNRAKQVGGCGKCANYVSPRQCLATPLTASRRF